MAEVLCLCWNLGSYIHFKAALLNCEVNIFYSQADFVYGKASILQYEVSVVA